MFLFHRGTTSASCYYQPSFEEPDFLCSLPSDAGTKRCSDIKPKENSTCIFLNHTTSDKYCGFDKFVPYSGEYYQCLQDGPNPFHTTVSFDNIGSAWMVIFQVST